MSIFPGSALNSFCNPAGSIPAATKIGYLGAGVTAFEILNIVGDKLPRGLMASIGFQIAW